MKYLDDFLARHDLSPWRPEKSHTPVGGRAAKLTQAGAARGSVSIADDFHGEPKPRPSVDYKVPSVSRATAVGGLEVLPPIAEGGELWRYEVAEWGQTRREQFDERAAIMEYDGGLVLLSRGVDST